jgi:hypothetical protein
MATALNPKVKIVTRRLRSSVRRTQARTLNQEKASRVIHSDARKAVIRIAPSKA